MKKTTILFFAAAAVFLGGCAAKQAAVPYAVGGSRADAQIEVQYDFNLGVTEPSEHSLLSIARKKCQAWGYDDAEAFGGHNKICQGEYCFAGKIKVQYQCLGNPN